MIKYLSLKNIGKLVCALIVIILVIAGIKYPKQIKRLIKRLVQREYLNQDSSCSKCGILFQDKIDATLEYDAKIIIARSAFQSEDFPTGT